MEASQIETLNGIELVLASNLTVVANSAPLRKTGTGCLALGATPRVTGTGDHILKIEEGSFKPLSATCTKNLKLSFDEGSSLVVNMMSGDTMFGEYGLLIESADGLTINGATLPVIVNDNRQKKKSCVRPVLTIPVENAEKVMSKIVVLDTNGGRLFTSTDQVEINDVAYTRIKAEVKRGIVILAQ